MVNCHRLASFFAVSAFLLIIVLPYAQAQGAPGPTASVTATPKPSSTLPATPSP
jgi:hypothetical protein